MTEEEKKAEMDRAAADAKKKADAEDGTPWSRMMSLMDAMAKRMDAFEDMFKQKDKKADAEPGKVEETVEQMNDDPDKKPGTDVDPKKDAKKKADSKDEFGEDKRIADAAEEKKREEERMRADAAVKARLDAMERQLPRDLSDEERNAMLDAQAKADSVAATFGDAAPRPMLGETLLPYRQRLATRFKSHSPDWKDVDLYKLDAHSFGVAERMVYADAAAAGRSPALVPANTLREVVRRDPLTGRQRIEFVGDPNAWLGDFKQEGFRAKLNKDPGVRVA